MRYVNVEGGGGMKGAKLSARGIAVDCGAGWAQRVFCGPISFEVEPASQWSCTCEGVAIHRARGGPSGDFELTACRP